MNFALLPPEVISALMYVGPGSGPMLGAASAWDALAADLYSSAGAYESVIATLTAGAWAGPASASMAAAAAPYVSWLNTTAAQAEQTADQAKAAAVAYETAFAETVPPPVVAANRSLLSMLIATNFFGQNLPAIAVTETQYADMWARDTGAMLAYALSSSAATTLPLFTEPESGTNPGGLLGQANAVAQAAEVSVGDAQSTVSTLQETFSAVPNALTGLASPAAVTDPIAFGLSPVQILDILGDLSGTLLDPEIGAAGLTLDGILAGTALPFDIDGYYVGLHTDDIVSGWARVPTYAGPVPLPEVVGSTVSAGLGEASSVGGLSVPAGWTTAAPAMRLASMTSPVASVAAAAETSGAGTLFSQMALAGMAGRAMAGTTGAGGGGAARPRVRAGAEKPANTNREAATTEIAEIAEPGAAATLPAGGPITSIATELRELAALRDAGILTDDEFTEQKRRLLPH